MFCMPVFPLTQNPAQTTGLYEMAERQALHVLQYGSQHCKEYHQWKGINLLIYYKGIIFY